MDRLLGNEAQLSQGRKDLLERSQPICEVHSGIYPRSSQGIVAMPWKLPSDITSLGGVVGAGVIFLTEKPKLTVQTQH